MFTSNSRETLDITVEVDESVLTAKKASTQSNTLVGAIDQGTSSTRFLVFTPQGKIAAWAQMEHTQIFPEGEDKVIKNTNLNLFSKKCDLVVLKPCRYAHNCQNPGLFASLILIVQHLRWDGMNTIPSKYGEMFCGVWKLSCLSYKRNE